MEKNTYKYLIVSAGCHREKHGNGNPIKRLVCIIGSKHRQRCMSLQKAGIYYIKSKINCSTKSIKFLMNCIYSCRGAYIDYFNYAYIWKIDIDYYKDILKFLIKYCEDNELIDYKNELIEYIRATGIETFTYCTAFHLEIKNSMQFMERNIEIANRINRIHNVNKVMKNINKDIKEIDSPLINGD